MKLYRWTKFTLVCDENKKEPITFILDIFCLTVQQSFRLKVMRSGDINMLVVKFDSSRNETIRPMLEKCIGYSSSTSVSFSAFANSNQDYIRLLDLGHLFSHCACNESGGLQSGHGTSKFIIP
ncbi:hypothetical protein RvY_11255 [Ramazzottius varieornatus]|uniref:Uncharacterized protein n=1 Tax=Ramazzottius varieornatus TaxID=947166 RepID=A0A1D1VJW5_RAMVA|nr:hypothetical protein RvY_11255 [Ramazzottius varieornatus]